MDFEADLNEEINSSDGSLSPVLSNNKTTKQLLRERKKLRKSRIKLMNRFSPESTGSQNEPQESNPSCETLDEVFTLSQTEIILETLENLEKIESLPSPASCRKVEEFDFKKPVSPICRNIKNQHNRKVFEGFQTAASKSITLSEDLVQKSKSLFDDILSPSGSKVEGRSNKLSLLSKSDSNKCDSPDFSGNRSIGNNKSETIGTLPDLCDSHKCKINGNNENQPRNSGLKKASVGEVSISKSALKSAENIINEEFISHPKCALDPQKKHDHEVAFKITSGRETKISSSALERAKNIFGDDLPKSTSKNTELNSENDNALVLDETLKGNKEICNENDLNVFNIDTNKNGNSSPRSFKGFTARSIEDNQYKANVFITSIEQFSERAAKDANKFRASKRSRDFSYSGPHEKRFKLLQVSSCQGFASASGTSIKISKCGLAKVLNIFKNLSDSYSSPTGFGSNSDLISLDSSFKEETGSKTALQTWSSPSCQLFDNTLKQAPFENVNSNADDQTSLENSSHDQDSSRSNTSLTGSIEKTQRKKRLGLPHRRPIQIVARDKLERAKLVFEDEKSPILPPLRAKEQYFMHVSTPLKNKGPFCIDSDLTPIKKVAGTSKEKVSVGVDVADGKIIIQECTKGGLDLWCENLENERIKMERNLQIIVQRQEALRTQKSLLLSNNEDRRRQRAGVLFKKKQTSSRIALQSVCRYDPALTTFSDITPQNAELVHFNYSRQYVPSVCTEDGASVIPNTNHCIGLSEIEVAFKLMAGVEPKLLPSGWVKNHFKWIVWKLVGYERFVADLKDCLTVDNVVQQLKYRYDREIDRAERPALRKIFEKDDVPQKRMVLCVSDIFHLKDNQVELELTDGWYSIRTIIDEPLCSQVYNQKIQIGTKLVTSGAQLLNCDGCHPLDTTDMVCLKIVCNSTRRAAWHAKLGYQRHVEPFPLRLRSLFPAGGTVGCIKVYVARVYPIKYLEKQNNLRVWRNKRAEEIRAQDWENERAKKLEEIREVVRKDYEKNMQSVDKSAMTNFSKSDIKIIRCPRTLYDLYQSSKDPENLQNMFSESQRNAVLEYQQGLLLKRQQEVKLKMEESFSTLQQSQRNVTSVLQLLLVDFFDNEGKSCYFQIWQPSETYQELVKESSLYYIYNTIPKKNGDLMSTKSTKFELVKEDVSQFHKYNRKLIPIQELCNLGGDPFNDEFDTVGIIVQITINGFNQNFWLADCDKLLFVNIFESPKNCSLLENLKCGQLVSVSNLKYCKSNYKFGEAVANHLTVISCYPKYKHLQEGMNAFNERFPKDANEFLHRCNQKLKYYIDKISISKNSMKGPSSSLVQSTSLNSFDVFDDSGEENSLNYSRVTRTDVALSMLDIDKLT